MKIRVVLALMAAAGAICLSGCQRSAAKADEPGIQQEVDRGEGAARGDEGGDQDVQYRTVATRNPGTGEIMTFKVPVETTANPETGTRTVRTVDPQTGRTITKQVPVTTEDGDKPQTRTVRLRDPQTGQIMTKAVPVAAATAPRDSNTSNTRTVRTRDPQTGRTVTSRVAVEGETAASVKPTAVTTPEYEISWQEGCSVEQAFDVINQLLFETFKLSYYYSGSAKHTPQMDYLSASLKARSTNNVLFEVSVALDSPEHVTLIIKASSKTQSKDVLKKHCLFIKEQISEAIAKEPEKEAVEQELWPYPKTMILNRSIDEISELLVGWNREAELEVRNFKSDKYYRYKTYRSVSGIEFLFSMTLLDVDKTKLVIDIKNYKGKDEFPFILKGLDKVLDGLEQIHAAVE